MPARSFSILELLLVVAMGAGLIALALTAYSNISLSSALTAGANALGDVLSEARQDAVTQNTAVEVRLYDVPGSSGPTPAYRALQLRWVEPDGSRPAIHSVVFLPPTVVMDATVGHSTLIGCDPVSVAADPSDPNMNAQTRVFHFLPDGSTDLTPGSSWFVTLRAARLSDPANFPANWASVTLDAATGRAQIFRP